MLNYKKVNYFSHLRYCKNLFFEFTSNFNRKTLINIGNFDSYAISFIIYLHKIHFSVSVMMFY